MFVYLLFVPLIPGCLFFAVYKDEVSRSIFRILRRHVGTPKHGKLHFFFNTKVLYASHHIHTVQLYSMLLNFGKTAFKIN